MTFFFNPKDDQSLDVFLVQKYTKMNRNFNKRNQEQYKIVLEKFDLSDFNFDKLCNWPF